MFDIVIVGGGPAGSTLARLVGKKYKTLILEKKRMDQSSALFDEKCCGGLIAPDAQKILAEMGLGIPRQVVISPQLFGVRTIDFDNLCERFYQRYYINCDRKAFDGWLQSLITDKVEIRRDCRYQSHEEREGVILAKYSENGTDKEIQTRFLIGADGAGSWVRKNAFPGYPLPQRYLAVQERLVNQGEQQYYGAFFDRTITDFYCWTIPKEDCVLLGAALACDKYWRGKFELLKAKLAHCGFRLDKPLGRESCLLFRPRYTCQLCTVKGAVALVGEAGGFISPSSAEGISYALQSARLLAEAFINGEKDWQALYAKYASVIVWNIRLKLLKCFFMYRPGIRRLIMRSGMASIKNIKRREDSFLLRKNFSA